MIADRAHGHPQLSRQLAGGGGPLEPVARRAGGAAAPRRVRVVATFDLSSYLACSRRCPNSCPPLNRLATSRSAEPSSASVRAPQPASAEPAAGHSTSTWPPSYKSCPRHSKMPTRGRPCKRRAKSSGAKRLPTYRHSGGRSGRRWCSAHARLRPEPGGKRSPQLPRCHERMTAGNELVYARS
jgi:hypothetical protein